jgi:hypothetical protein
MPSAPRVDAPAAMRLVTPSAPLLPVTMAGFLAEISERAKMPVVSTDVRQWLNDAVQSVRPELAGVRRKMEENGFLNYPISKVFGNADVTVYGVGNNDGVNFCAPFLVNDQSTMQSPFQAARQGPALAEGPALTALHFAMQDWPKGSPVSMMEGLLPLSKLHDFGSQFEVGLDRPLHYGTKAGDLLIGYDSDPGSGMGMLHVLSRTVGGETLLDRSYTFAWR